MCEVGFSLQSNSIFLRRTAGGFEKLAIISSPRAAHRCGLRLRSANVHGGEFLATGPGRGMIADAPTKELLRDLRIAVRDFSRERCGTVGFPGHLLARTCQQIGPTSQDFALEVSPMKKSRFTESQIVAILKEGEVGGGMNLHAKRLERGRFAGQGAGATQPVCRTKSWCAVGLPRPDGRRPSGVNDQRSRRSRRYSPASLRSRAVSLQNC
jgi:hypothetical protein